MIHLGYIKEDIQNIAEVISSVLNVDVTIVDENLMRIAGTGTYREKIGEKISNHSAFENAIDLGESFIIEDPRKDKICERCKGKADCREFAEVCCPIKLEEKIYGVIGLIAFSENQRENIRQNKENLMGFLNKMADLISSKIKAENKSSELKIETKRLETLLNNMDKAVISTDKNGNIDKYNDKLKKMFRLKEDLENKNIFELFSFIKIENLSSTFTHKQENQIFSGIYHANPIIIEDEIKGYVFDFTDHDSAIKDFNEITLVDYDVKFSNIIGNSVSMEKVKKEAQMASKSSSTVLITGESGTGKELFARAIHNMSSRNSLSFIAINCAAIPDNLLESELFGYEEGAFTGAKKGGKVGKFELANKGSLFLDEIGDMSLHLQGKILRVLQEREVEKIGSKVNVPIDVRIIAATNKNLEVMVEKGEFREDLYYRLNVIPVHIPPLRERKEDLPLLVEHLIENYSKKLNKVIYGIDSDAIRKVLSYDWPGNVRQLQNVIEYSINMTNSNNIKYENLPEKLKKENKMTSYLEEEIFPLRELEKREIGKALNQYKEYKKDKEKVAKALGISRATLYRKLKEYEIE